MSKQPPPAARREPPVKIATGPDTHFNMRFDSAELLCVMDRVEGVLERLKSKPDQPSRKQLLGHLLLLGVKQMESIMSKATKGKPKPKGGKGC
jgi:hypothetical protein